jgi:S-adenosylmethionine hydrolase
LDYLGSEVGVKRPTDEYDTKFRTRVYAGIGAATSETTWEDYSELVMQLLRTDPDDVFIKVDYSDELGAVITKITTKDIEDSEFTESEIVGFLERSLPGSRRVVIRYLDGFQFSDPATTDEKLGKGWGEGVWTV